MKCLALVGVQALAAVFSEPSAKAYAPTLILKPRFNGPLVKISPTGQARSDSVTIARNLKAAARPAASTSS